MSESPSWLPPDPRYRVQFGADGKWHCVRGDALRPGDDWWFGCQDCTTLERAEAWMRKMRVIDVVQAAAAEVFTPEGVEIWLGALNPLLHGRSPMELIVSGEHERVLQLLEQLASGAFT